MCVGSHQSTAAGARRPYRTVSGSDACKLICKVPRWNPNDKYARASLFGEKKKAQQCSAASQFNLLIMACSQSPGDQIGAGFPPQAHFLPVHVCHPALCSSWAIFVGLVRLHLKREQPGAMGRIKACFQSNTPQLPARLHRLPSPLPFPSWVNVKIPINFQPDDLWPRMSQDNFLCMVRRGQGRYL